MITATTNNKYGNFDFTGEGKEIPFRHHTDCICKIKTKKEATEIGFLPSGKNDWFIISKFQFIIIREADDKSPVGYLVYINDISPNGIFINGGKRTKARLVARGFGEQKSEVLKDSPTSTKESPLLELQIISAKG